MPDNDRVMHANDLDVTLESMDLSDRVRMWMLLNMIAQKTGNLSEM